MRVLTLMQPWASGVVDIFPPATRPPKVWETRSWKPSLAMAQIMRTEGFLIHCSQKPPDRVTRCSWPFLSYYPSDFQHPQGCIIGRVKLGRVITTHDWVREFKPHLRGPAAETAASREYQWGDYSAGRWAWELIYQVKFKTPIPAKGSLSIWQYNEPIDISTQ